ncbi:unnamed protein product [Lampetra fluviatilis]
MASRRGAHIDQRQRHERRRSAETPGDAAAVTSPSHLLPARLVTPDRWRRNSEPPRRVEEQDAPIAPGGGGRIAQLELPQVTRGRRSDSRDLTVTHRGTRTDWSVEILSFRSSDKFLDSPSPPSPPTTATMPFYKRVLSPGGGDDAGATNPRGRASEPCEDLGHASSRALGDTLRQLAGLARHALGMFAELEAAARLVALRSERLEGRVRALRAASAALDCRAVAVRE